jgi:hypothetical protein
MIQRIIESMERFLPFSLATMTPEESLRRENVPEVRLFHKTTKVFGGDKRDRTADLLLARQALSQLSYIPTWWA